MIQPKTIGKAIKLMYAEASERHRRVDQFLKEGRTDLALAEIRQASEGHVERHSRLGEDNVIKAVRLFYEIAQEAGVESFVLVGGASGVLQGLKKATKDVDVETNGMDFRRLSDYLGSGRNRFDGAFYGATGGRMDFHSGGTHYEVYCNEENAGRPYMNTDFTVDGLHLTIRRKEFLKSKMKS